MSIGRATTIGVLERTKSFAVKIFKMCSSLPKTMPAKTLGMQVLRSGTSVGSQY
ncbi:MAG: four helix bundle protein [Pirellulales bacterium]|nr:four helix bundle protein [Pirellulales bacterium]